MTRHTYYAEYRSASGQPANGYVEFTNKAAAIAQAHVYARECLIPRSGGIAVAGRVEPYDEDGNTRLWCWHDPAEGGYNCVSEDQS